MTAYGGIAIKAPSILNLATGWKWVVRFMRLLFYAWRNVFVTNRLAGSLGLQEWLGCSGEQTVLLGESNHDSSVDQPVTQSLCRLSNSVKIWIEISLVQKYPYPFVVVVIFCNWRAIVLPNLQLTHHCNLTFLLCTTNEKNSLHTNYIYCITISISC
jgi:hypothetical protein